MRRRSVNAARRKFFPNEEKVFVEVLQHIKRDDNEQKVLYITTFSRIDENIKKWSKMGVFGGSKKVRFLALFWPRYIRENVADLARALSGIRP